MTTLRSPRQLIRGITFCFVLALTACNGGGGGGASPPPASSTCIWDSSTWDNCNWSG